jgi:hypothetical protein
LREESGAGFEDFESGDEPEESEEPEEPDSFNPGDSEPDYSLVLPAFTFLPLLVRLSVR